jgi:hypothetical protein
LPGKEKQGTKVNNNILAFLAVVSAPQRNGSANAKQHRYLNTKSRDARLPGKWDFALGKKERQSLAYAMGALLNSG